MVLLFLVCKGFVAHLLRARLAMSVMEFVVREGYMASE